jgi:hypothetical protein
VAFLLAGVAAFGFPGETTDAHVVMAIAEVLGPLGVTTICLVGLGERERGTQARSLAKPWLALVLAPVLLIELACVAGLVCSTAIQADVVQAGLVGIGWGGAVAVLVFPFAFPTGRRGTWRLAVGTLLGGLAIVVKLGSVREHLSRTGGDAVFLATVLAAVLDCRTCLG